MRIDTRNMVSITDAARSMSRLAGEVENGRTVVVLRNNAPALAMVPVSEMDRLDSLEERESDLRLLGLAMAREMLDNGTRHDLGEVLAELNVDLGDEE